MQKIIDYRFQSDSGVNAPGFKINYYFHNDTDDMTNKGSQLFYTLIWVEYSIIQTFYSWDFNLCHGSMWRSV